MRSAMSVLVPVQLLTLAAVSGTAMAWPPWKHHMSVNFINEVDDARATLVVHCKSRDDDLGQHAVGLHQQYGFGFYPNFYGTTLFWCGFQWGGRSQSFTVWQDSGPWGRQERFCNQCVYMVCWDGFFRSEGPAGPFTRVRVWN